MENITKSPLHLIGIQLPEKTTNANGQSAIDCGNLWQQFETENFAARISDKVGNEIYAVYFEYEGDHNQPFSYFIGCEVKPGAKVPEEMSSLIIPEQACIKFTAKGKMPDCIAKSWREIWASNIKRGYQYDFEVYDERSKDWSNAEVEIFVSVA